MIEIQISGPEGIGKSVLMADIATHLKSLGHNVTCVEGENDDHEFAVNTVYLLTRRPRNIRINTQKTL